MIEFGNRVFRVPNRLVFEGCSSSMTPTPKMTDREVLKVKLNVMRQEHRDLDEAVKALQDSPAIDQLLLRRLKKQKLKLKDQIAVIEDQLTPDIIA